MPTVRKTKAGGPGPPAAQGLPRSVSLSAQGLPAALHQNSCDAQTNGGPTCERKERDPHGVPRSVVDFASIVPLSAQSTPKQAIRSGNFAF